MKSKAFKSGKETVKPDKEHATNTSAGKSGKKPFVEPELKEYPSLKEVTLLSMPGASGRDVFQDVPVGAENTHPLIPSF